MCVSKEYLRQYSVPARLPNTLMDIGDFNARQPVPYLSSTKLLLVQHQVITSVAPSCYLSSTKYYLSSTMDILFASLALCDLVTCVAPCFQSCSEAFTAPDSYSFCQSLPAEISSHSMCSRIRSASNRASSVRMPDGGAGENDTLPATACWPITASK